MMALKSNAGISDKAHRWAKFRKQAKGIKLSPLTSWVDTISSDVDPS